VIETSSAQSRNAGRIGVATENGLAGSLGSNWVAANTTSDTTNKVSTPNARRRR
jgi:hypothetical protein